ncbi:hypothetical protein ACLQ2S_15115 [Micromonospora sp. DT48]|uniref:hypothetical protein n=1 Tax=unclassified Micromonospora TaxID=2617518 RepID=UPI0012BD384F|nr:hypothetical protein [Micromonospora sp. CP22]MTK04279.1 hypothetical protein [Micromonospora sp. CP22]
MQRTQPGIADRLARTNPTTVFLVTLLLALVAFFTPGVVGGLFTLLLAGALAALLVTTWAVQTPQNRAIRLIVLTLLVTAGLVKLL